MTQLSRRRFLGILGAGTSGLLASAALDPERLLWVPGQRKLFLPPERTLVQARTLQEALSKGLTALFPDGTKLMISLSAQGAWQSEAWQPGGVGWAGMTLSERLASEVRGVEAMGGRVVKIGDLYSIGSDPHWRQQLQPGWNW